MNRKIYKDGTFIWYNEDYDTIERKRKIRMKTKKFLETLLAGLTCLSFWSGTGEAADARWMTGPAIQRQGHYPRGWA